MQILFFTRLVLYILAFIFPAIHPSVAVPYDQTGLWMWFFLVPGEMFIGFYLGPPRLRVLPWFLTAAGFLIITTFVISGFSSYTLYSIIAGSTVFLLTVFIFKMGRRGHMLAVIEQFFLGFLYYKLLTFSRASESVAEASADPDRNSFSCSWCHSLQSRFPRRETEKENERGISFYRDPGPFAFCDNPGHT